MEINICLVTDDNYAMPTGITVYSLLKNRNHKLKYHIYILGKKISKKQKDKFMEMNEKNFTVEVVDIIEKENFAQYRIENIPANETSIYKFFIPEILKDLDKVIYLDGDIIVQKDLQELFNINLNKKCIGAVKDTNGLDYKELRNDNYQYFNSGVLLMNLQKMRKENFAERLLNYRKTGYNKLMDQDTFNYVMKDEVVLLPFTYNTQISALSSVILGTNQYNIKIFRKYWNMNKKYKDIKEIFDDAFILHYTTAKPWKYYDGYGNDLWLEYYIKSPYGQKRLNRSPYYIEKIINSSTYQMSSQLIKPLKSLKTGVRKNKKYHKFLKNFLAK